MAYFASSAMASYGWGLTQILSGLCGSEMPQMNVPPIIDFVFTPGYPSSTIDLLINSFSISPPNNPTVTESPSSAFIRNREEFMKQQDKVK